MSAYTVSRLALDAGVSVHIVRDYLLRGLLRPVACTPGGYGLFDDAALQRLCFVRAAFEAGIGLDALAPQTLPGAQRMAAALPDMADARRATAAVRERRVQLIKQGAQQPEPQAGVDTPTRQLHKTRRQRLPGAPVHAGDCVIGRARRSIGDFPLKIPAGHAPVGLQPAAMLRAAQHQGELPDE